MVSEPRRPDSQDPVLLEFWIAAGLDLAALDVLNRRIRLAGSWEGSSRPRMGAHSWEDVIVDVLRDEGSIRRQIARVDALSGNDEVVVSLRDGLLGEAVIEVAQPSWWWTGPGTPLLVRRRVGSIEIPVDEPNAASEVVEAIAKIRRARRASFMRCRFCGHGFAPEQRFEDDVCHGCASEHLGVVY